MSKKYILPCAGYDRSGGIITRKSSEIIMSKYKNVIIGSVAALAAGRPGELRNLRLGKFITLNGCSVNCASKIATQCGSRMFDSLDVSEIVGTEKNEEKKIEATVASIESLLALGTSARLNHTKSVSLWENGAEMVTLTIDKFTIKAKRGFLYSDNDFWVSKEGELVRVGVTDVLQQMASDIYFVDLTQPSTSVTFGDDVGMIESTKTAFEIIVPVSGTIIERNERLTDSPELVNMSPYDEGWLYVIRPDDPTEFELLKDAEEYLEFAAAKAQKEIGKKTTD